MSETEKITINMGAVDLGKIDLLVQEGSYTNRTDFIRTAIRNQIDKHNIEIQQSVTRNSFVVGALIYDRKDLEKMRAKGEKINLKIIGLLHLQNDIDTELASQVIESIQVRGIFQASEDVRKVLAEKTQPGNRPASN
jgi:Arc/MetJ-type ribon-helix-helix transcriptional regulator